MPRKPNATDTIKITISATPLMAEMLDWLVSRGTFGRTRTEAAERIVSERLREFQTDEKFKPKGESP